MQLKTNSLLQSGKYRIIRLLGQGGFGITYLAENTMLGKQVAIKEFFPKDFCGRDNTSHLTLGTQNNADTVSKLKARFIKEAQNIAKLDHPGIVHIHDIFEENNTAYYVMDYIDGENLNEIVKRNGPLPEGKAVKYVEKVGEALEYIHSRNMTHFDVKPANIVIRKKDDQPILIDFGLSKQYDAHGDATSTLMQGISQGYSPIELYNYGSVSTFSPQTDVYSLGATLFYLISGKVPPQPSSIIENGLELSFVGDPKLRKAIESSMQVGRGKRPESMRKFLNSLSSFEKNRENVATHHSAYQSNDDDSTRIITEPVYDSTPEPQISVPKGKDKWPSFVSLLTIAIVIVMIFMIRSCGETNHTGYADSIDDSIAVDYDCDTIESYYVPGIGECKYVGELNDTCASPEGVGYAIFQSGEATRYDGHWSNGVPDGQGEYHLNNGDSFKGEFKNGKYYQGTYTIASSGEYFKGYFSNGTPSSGTWYDKNGNVLEQL